MLDTAPSTTLSFSLLGPVQAWRGAPAERGAPRTGTEVDIGSPQQRGTLAMLLLRAGTMVTLDEMISGLWGDEPPRSAVTTLRTYIYRLRRVLQDEGPQGTRLESGTGGYVLHVPEDAVDVNRFRAHSVRASLAGRRGDRHGAAAELSAALALPDGRPLAGVQGPYAEGQRARLEQCVATAHLDLIENQILLGRYRDVLPDLMAMAAANPLWEEVQALYMTALHGTGRTAEALAHYRRSRRALVDELGIEPGTRLREAMNQILAGGSAQAPADRRPPRGPEHHRRRSVWVSRRRLVR
ncbi:DNA-binding SARP family transcriptional activator [Actinoplanes lutulentus]|uniref:DNA-binding SARP family transcriptional activator n=1 Tax=Actinoplanes lutulentus TaxID=1287878 RepID=A0A327ZNN1_9ACTN|nr:AfsR/SARP family transcriptional regulator [Actinoplanes lutulentus]MBB2940582.1 DNA-binding SARP family transcriptional activator [Actinoplanes lutulentus]RAK42894.1 DNA-binding SARP family transcriptional activator [Actinoplanes lutulentus]